MPDRVQRDDWCEIRRASAGIRRRVLDHTIAHAGGYLSQACSAAEILATLYLKTLRLGPSVAPMIPRPFGGVPAVGNQAYATGGDYHGAKGAALDRFYLSPAHYALVLYAALVEAGRMAPEALAQFNRDGSTVEMIGAEHSPGFEMMGGALAQTMSQAAGIALARKRRDEEGRTFVFLSDGEFQEGQTWETVAAMGFYRLDHMRVIVDVNGQQCDGMTKDVMTTEPLDGRIEAFGAQAVVVDGHDPQAIRRGGQRGVRRPPAFRALPYRPLPRCRRARGAPAKAALRALHLARRARKLRHLP